MEADSSDVSTSQGIVKDSWQLPDVRREAWNCYRVVDGGIPVLVLSSQRNNSVGRRNRELKLQGVLFSKTKGK